MNLKKEISDRLSNKSSYRATDTSGAVVGLLAGLAVGAVLGVLFAPDSGKRIREQISDKALGLTDNMKDGFIALKEQLSAQKDNIMGLKDRLAENIKGKTGTVNQEPKGSKNAESGRPESTVESMAANTNNPVQQI